MEWANRLYTWGGRLTLVGTFVALAAAALSLIGGRVRDRAADKAFADLNVEAANTRARAAALENEAAQARLELEQLKARAAPRALTPREQAILVVSIRALGGAEIEMSSANDAESQEYAAQFEAVFQHAGTKVHLGMTVQPGRPNGVAIASTDSRQTQALRAALSAAQIPWSFANIREHLWIGPKAP